MKKTFLLMITGLLATITTLARLPEDTAQLRLEMLRQMDSIENTLHYKTGKIELGNGVASINVPANFKFLEDAEAKFVVEDLWGNPPSGSTPLGLLMPTSTQATGSAGYAFIIYFDEQGHVKDKDADEVNYDELLTQLKEENVEANKERQRLGLSTLNLLGWAAKPYYDKDKKILHWAKEYAVPGTEDNTLNYDVRVLGRRGVLILQAVSGMSEYDSVKAHINDVFSMVAFNEGHRYADFDSKTDKIAAVTIGGLVGAKIAAKVGFFAVIGKFLKFIIAGVVLLGGAIWRFITGRKKKEEEYVYQPQTAPKNDDNPATPAS